MKLSLSVRVAESLGSKREAALSLESLSRLAAAEGYHALCMRASQIGIDTPPDVVRQKRRELTSAGLRVSMVTGDFAIPENTEESSQALRDITPYLEVAEALDCDLLRVSMKHREDIEWAQRASDEANERGVRLAHQCHAASLFERVGESLEVIRRVNRRNFGLIYEPANLALCGEAWGPAAIEALAPYMFNVYLQNLQVRPEGRDVAQTWCRGDIRFNQIPIWQSGGINFPLVLSTLEKTGYDEYVTVHQSFGGLVDPQEAIQRCALYLKSVVRFGG